MEKLFKYRPNAYHHVTFATKRRKLVLASDIRQRVLYWFDRIAQENGFQLLERNTWLEHVHMLIFVRPGEDLSYVMNLFKGTCARQIFLEFTELKLDMREIHLWGWRFHAEEVPPSGIEAVRLYIRDQERIHGQRADRLPVAAWERWQDLEL
jgi:REP element-mobilizing transposase RayT